jgi:hypothetical protein
MSTPERGRLRAAVLRYSVSASTPDVAGAYAGPSSNCTDGGLSAWAGQTYGQIPGTSPYNPKPFPYYARTAGATSEVDINGQTASTFSISMTYLSSTPTIVTTGNPGGPCPGSGGSGSPEVIGLRESRSRPVTDQGIQRGAAGTPRQPRQPHCAPPRLTLMCGS